MLIGDAHDKFETIIEHHICGFHKNHPGERWAGCTCSSTYICKRSCKQGPITKKPEPDELYKSRLGYLGR